MGIFLIIIMGILYKNRVINSTNKIIKEQQKMVDKYVLIITTDLKGIITNANDAYCNKIGYSKEELIGNSPKILKHPSMNNSVFKELWITIINDKTWSGEVENLTKDKKDVYFFINIEPIFKDNIKIGYRSICEDITDKKRVEKLSVTDQLTKLYNRVKLDQVFNEEINRAKRYNHPFSIIILDIDYFKLVNDNYGHNIGDETLISIAKILQNSIRETDTIGRWGGEEFMILAAETTIENTFALAEKIRKNIEKYNFNVISHKTASFGISTYKLGDTQEVLVQKADEALYIAKKSGRNRVEVVK